MEVGTPSRRPTLSPLAYRSSDFRAWERAASASTRQKALTRALFCSIRDSAASVASTGESSRESKSSRSSVAGRKATSSMLTSAASRNGYGVPGVLQSVPLLRLYHSHSLGDRYTSTPLRVSTSRKILPAGKVPGPCESSVQRFAWTPASSGQGPGKVAQAAALRPPARPLPRLAHHKCRAHPRKRRVDPMLFDTLESLSSRLLGKRRFRWLSRCSERLCGPFVPR